ncbi:erythromycin esterase family protein [Streptomyces sp. NPDC057148]|uniref:erythromycin esterase family protein n=1 Tax=unclassified Streptomyces TaxID=2593676 RepID=UPI003643EE17
MTIEALLQAERSDGLRRYLAGSQVEGRWAPTPPGGCDTRAAVSRSPSTTATSCTPATIRKSARSRIGLTFDRGTVNALPEFTAQRPESCTVAPAPAGHNEHTLDKVRHRDFSIDLRTAPPVARAWLAEARPTRSYGLYWSTGAPETALGRSYDILVHLHRVKDAHILP